MIGLGLCSGLGFCFWVREYEDSDAVGITVFSVPL